MISEPPVIDYSNNPDYHLCQRCETYKHNDDWYWNRQGNSVKKYRSQYCKECSTSKYREEYSKKRSNKASEFVYAKPGVYADELQKELTFELLTLLGYIYNEEKGIWLKSGIKELNENGEVFFPNVKKQKKKKRKNVKLTDEDFESIHKLYKEGYNSNQIAKMLNQKSSTVYKRLSTYEPTFKRTYKIGGLGNT